MPTLFDYRWRFYIQAISNTQPRSWVFRDTLSPQTARQIDSNPLSLNTPSQRLAALRMLIPPCVELSPLPVRDQPKTLGDAHFWQFPAITERLAFERHAESQLPDWQPELSSPVSTYLGLPWASYIDKKIVPDDVKRVFLTRLRGYRALADEWQLAWGKDVKIHTVCQHIYWKRLLPLWAELGITDLHLSHCEPASAETAKQFGICVHSWALAAANVVNPDRSEGLIIGKKIPERNLLASFIGAHMPHYRSEVRLRLREEIIKDASSDVLFELRDDWHFNPLVYREQIAGEMLNDAERISEQKSTFHYNQVLSNSVFALCPEGAGPNTLRLWEALAVGSIPVVIVEDWLWPEIPGKELVWEDAVIAIRRNEVDGLIKRLRKIHRTKPEQLEMVQKAGMALYERFAQSVCF